MNDKPDEGFLGYIRETDCILIGGRIYGIVYGKETDDFVEFRNTRFGLSTGPLLKDIEKNWSVEHPEEMRELIDSELENKLRSLGNVTRYWRIVSDPKMRMKALAYDVINSVCMKDVLHPKKAENDDDDVSSETLTKHGDEIARKLSKYQVSSVIAKKDMMVLNGAAYALEECKENEKRECFKNGAAFAKIGKRSFRSKGQHRDFIDKIKEKQDQLMIQKVKQEIERDTSLQSRVRGIRDKKAEDIMKLDDFFDNDTNIGFASNSRGFFIYTKTPSYILWEHVNDRYYLFPPAKVAVQILVDSMYEIRPSFPIVMNRYKHPAVPEINLSNQIICFDNFDRSSIDFSKPVNTISMFLHHGCKMLMENYCSDGNAFQNIENKTYADLFSDLEVDKVQLGRRTPTNLQACLREKNKH